MEEHMRQRGSQTALRHQARRQQDIRQIRYRRIRQTALEMMLLDRHRRAVDDGCARQQQGNRLRRRAAHDLCAEAEVRHANDGEHTALDDRNRVQQRRDRRRRNGRFRQPHMEREDSRLDAEAEERAKVTSNT